MHNVDAYRYQKARWQSPVIHLTKLGSFRGLCGVWADFDPTSYPALRLKPCGRCKREIRKMFPAFIPERIPRWVDGEWNELPATG